VKAESLGWLAPAPLWGEGGVGLESSELLQPFLTELTSDQFVSEFLGVMGAQGGASPANLAAMAPSVTSDGAYRLFQPLSQRYYLVTASLVCRRVGIPDHAVQRSEGERTTFVVRRLAADGSEQAFVPVAGSAAIPGDPPSGSWKAASAGQLADGEDQLPMHAAPVAGFAAPGSTAATFGMSEPGRRTVHYGYISTGRRERMVTALSDSKAVADLKSVDPSDQENPTLSELWTKVILPWGVLQGTLPPWPPPTAPPAGTDTDYSSLYILLDLNAWLKKYLPTVYNALISGATLPSGTDAEALREALASTQVQVGTRPLPSTWPPPPPPPAPPFPVPPSPSPIALAQALKDLVPFASLVTGADTQSPSTDYDLTSYINQSSPPVPALPVNWLEDAQTGPPTSAPASLAYLALAALHEAHVKPSVPDELKGMIKADPAVPVSGHAPATYIIRTVFEHDPCLPVLSEPSRPFQLARAMDGDAPARKIRIALPDISNMRQFQRGVAIEMPPSLRRLLDRVTPAMLQGQGLGGDPGVELGMICSFSIQIMWVLSFIVMFLFAISFNIIFWWMAFIKICFPIPVPTSPPKNPSP
jgi:hypothetical protein